MMIITTRHSGGSYLNRVELQNGCEVRERSGLYILSTLQGSNKNQTTGKLDELKLKENLNAAIDVYINRVKGAATCAGVPIQY